MAEIYFSQNIKFLRERKRLSQEFLAESIGLTRVKLNALENGHTKAPQPEDYLRFSNFFKMSIDSLIKVDLSRLSELKLRELEAGNDVYAMGRNLRVLAITVDEKNKENVEYVPVKAKAGYRSGYHDPEYIASLPKYSIPDLPSKGTYRIFPTVGDSMLPIPEGSDIIASYVADWKSIKPNTLCILILKEEQDFVFKQVTLEADGRFFLRSLNHSYSPYWVKVEDVLEVWQYHKHLTAVVPDGGSDVHEMVKMMKTMQKDIEMLKKRK